MNHENVDSRKVEFASTDRLGSQEGTRAVRDLAERLRSKLATARSAAVVSDEEWEWYIILTLSLSGFARILHLSLCYLPLCLIASSNSPRYSGMLGGFCSVEIQRWNLLRPGFTLTSGPGSSMAERRQNRSLPRSQGVSKVCQLSGCPWFCLGLSSILLAFRNSGFDLPRRVYNVWA
jgi:hypothetical protein